MDDQTLGPKKTGFFKWQYVCPDMTLRAEGEQLARENAHHYAAWAFKEALKADARTVAVSVLDEEVRRDPLFHKSYRIYTLLFVVALLDPDEAEVGDLVHPLALPRVTTNDEDFPIDYQDTNRRLYERIPHHGYWRRTR